ncbi:MAG: COG1361 S-layer family protein [Candidatus Hadarchaeum sp.]|uniref:COG1361 S-layer family protein n=1 Tax=Candidatus Hadarchaeum sp. TaxID=2883567 RepID=UPI003D13146B
MKKALALLASALVILTIIGCAGTASATDGSLNLGWSLLDNYLRPGGETTLVLSIQNATPVKIYHVELSFKTGEELSLDPADFYLYSISPMSSQLTSFKIKASENATPRVAYVEITAKYRVGSVSADENELKIWVPVVIRSAPLLKVEKVEYDQDPISPGSTVTVSFEVRNYGDGPAKDLVVSLDQSAGTFVTDLSEKYAGEVAVGGSARLSFRLSINQNLSAGVYSIPILLSYWDETKSQPFSSREFAGMRVYGNINLITTLNAQDKVAAGSSGSMEIKIANAGTMEVQFLQLNVRGSSIFDEITPQSIYIGRLKSDDYDTERIYFKIGKDVAKGTYPVDLELVYQDPFGKQFTEAKTVYLNVLAKEDLNKPFEVPAWQLAIIALVIVIVIYYLWRKRRK